MMNENVRVMHENYSKKALNKVMAYKCSALLLCVVTGSDSSPICRCSIEQRQENTQGSKEQKEKAPKGRKTNKIQRYITVTSFH